MPVHKLTLIATAAALTVATVTYAGSHLTQNQQRAMNARQSQMQLNVFNIGALGAMAQGNIPYDADIAAAAAANLAALARIDQTRYWVDGTDSSVEGSRAKPEIWTDRAGFNTANAALATATIELAAVAGDGLDAMRTAFGPVGKACASCHEVYRVPNN